MELRQLEMLLAVYETGSYLGAGKLLHVSHSAVHRQIRLLEREVKDRVLRRTGKRVELTETGRILADLARRVRQEVGDAVQQIHDLNQLHEGSLHIGTGTSLLLFFLPRALEAFRRRFPGIELHVKTEPADLVVQEVGDGRLDIGVIYLPAAQSLSGGAVEFEQLDREEFVPVVTKGHPLARKKRAFLSDLLDYPLVLFPPSSSVRHLVDALFQKEQLTPHIVMELENEEAMEKMIGINRGVAFMSRRRVARAPVSPVPLANRTISCPVGIVLRKSNYLPKAVAEFARLCRENRK